MSDMPRRSWRELRFFCVVLLALPFVAGCGSEEVERGIHVRQGEARLASLLRKRDVTPGSTKPMLPLSVAWAAFKEFAAVPVRPSELSDEPLSDGLLFEFGVFDFGGKWGETLQVIFVRQLTTADGDLQQVHLVAHFTPSAFDEIRERINVALCAEAQGCAARCVFEGTDALVGDRCVLTLAAGQAAPADRVLGSAGAWSFDTGGISTEAQRASWIAFVESSPVFRQLAGELEPLGYEVWQDSAE
jgi:hypothetical protein